MKKVVLCLLKGCLLVGWGNGGGKVTLAVRLVLGHQMPVTIALYATLKIMVFKVQKILTYKEPVKEMSQIYTMKEQTNTNMRSFL